MQTLTLRTFGAGFLAGAFTILLSTSIATSQGKAGGGIAGNCAADIAPTGGDGFVDVDDLLMVINSWGTCNQCKVDEFEPNDDCNHQVTLATVGSEATITYSDLALENADAVDVFRINAVETDQSCGCGFPGLDEDYKLTITLTVPADAPGPLELCTGTSCSNVEQFCLVAAPGQSVSHTWTLDGECSAGTTDSYVVYVRIKAAPGGGCSDYQLKYFFDAGYCL